MADALFRAAAVLGLSFSFAAGVQAGDLLRGGSPAGTRGAGKAPANPNSAVPDQARANAQDALKRTTQVLDSVRAMQEAARGLTVKGGGTLSVGGGRPVPNGLGPGGLQVAPGVPVNLGKPALGENAGLWVGANLPVQSQLGGRTRVTIEQTAPQALLNWETFNVGRETTLTFNQSRGGVSQTKWIALNKVNDPSGRPSQILGSIEAPGQVYVINRNGIIFGGSSQVSVGTLTASTLPINDNLVSRGLLNNPDAQFLFSALPLAAGTKGGTPAFNPTIADREFQVSANVTDYTLAEQVALTASNAPVRAPELTFRNSTGAVERLLSGTDYTLAIDTATRRVTAAFTPAGLQKVGAANVTATYTPVVVKSGDIVVQAGARLSSTVTAEGNGGRVLLVGANVRNEGAISTPAGQTILAAGLQLGLDGHRSADASLRGLDTYVGAVTVAGVSLAPAGTATNAGLIEAPRGNVTLTGKTVEQLRVIESATTTALNGRIDLSAEYDSIANTNYDSTNPSRGPIFLKRATGTVEVGPGSVTRIRPDLAGEDRAVGTQLALPSQINLTGRAVHFAGGSEVLAPNATVNVSAGNWISIGPTSPTQFHYTSGQIYFDAGASIDVAGSVDVIAPITENILTLQLRGAELADSPLQRAGLLRGTTLSIDVRKTGVYNGRYWVGTPLGDVSGFLGIIERSVGELTVGGGTVNLNAGESVILQRGSKIDVSGGWINFEGGLVQTTRVLSGGVLLDLSQATPDRVYDGVYTGTSTFSNARYGVTETFAQPLALTGARYEAGYLQGANAGAITITAPSQALDGTLLGRAAQGPRQQNETTFAPAQAGALNLNFRNEAPFGSGFYAASPAPPRITFDAPSGLRAADAFEVDASGNPGELREDRKKTIFLPPALLAENGFSTLAIDNSDGEIVVPQQTKLVAPFRGSISLRAANVEIDGEVSAPGGALNFTVFNDSPYQRTLDEIPTPDKPTPKVDPNRGVLSLGETATLSTAGLITDFRPGGADEFGRSGRPPLTAGGTITINAFSADLARGSTIDVSGGVSISASGQRSYGNGGSITINAGNEPDFQPLFGGSLKLGSTLKGFSGARGGALTIQASLIQVGGTLPPLVPSRTQEELVYLISGVEVRRDELLYLPPDFFSEGGFTSFTLNGLGKAIDATKLSFLPAVSIAPGTIIEPVAQSVLAVGGGAAPVALEPFLKPQGLRTPVSLAFGAGTTVDDNRLIAAVTLRGDIVMGRGAAITTDPGASVTFNGSTVAILGSVTAPGGSISISGAGVFPLSTPSGPKDDEKKALPTVHFGPQSQLSTAGVVVLTPDAYDRRVGTVLPGGTITVQGNIVAEAGAVLDVSGTNGLLDLAPLALASSIGATDSLNGNRLVPVNSGLNSPLSSLHTVPTRIDSDAGTIILRGSQELFTDATLLGYAGGPTARGGSLSISSGRYLDPTAQLTPSPLGVNLLVTQAGQSISTGYYKGQTAIGQAVPGTGPNASLGLGHFAADTFQYGGFDSLMLSGNSPSGSPTGAVGFHGPVSIRAPRSLSVADGGVIFADAAVDLQAPYVALGTGFTAPLQPGDVGELGLVPNFRALPTFGPGSLTVRAGLIDIGKLSLQNIGRATFIAAGGDIRGNGTLDIAGALTLRAGQIYPTTAGYFTIAAYDPGIAVVASSANSTQVTLASATLPPGFGVGSPLLGSKVASINGATVTLEGNANATITGETQVVFAPGTSSVTVQASGTRPLPLSAGGTLSIYASNIEQDGTLRAPLGTINLGWDGTGTSPLDYLTGAGLQAGVSVPVTRRLTLGGGSVTSISAIDPFTGEGALLPYGFNASGSFWIDPTGTDITAGGVVQKSVNLAGGNIAQLSGSTIDLRGGGDFYAYRWISGLGGSIDLLGSAGAAWNPGASYTAGQLVSFGGATYSARRSNQGITPAIGEDWSPVPRSFAILPDYGTNYAPYAAFNDRVNALNLAAGDPGYVGRGLAVGDRITLGASSGLPGGTYTLLPARYALLPGGVLVTPQSGGAIGTFQNPDGASLVSGYRFNDLNAAQGQPLRALRFEVAPADVFRQRAEYEDSFANSFLRDSALALGTPVPRLPLDSGRAAFATLTGLRIEGDILGRSTADGHDAQIDISSLADILIDDRGTGGPAGTVVLSAAKLSSFGAESLLIGGLRQSSPAGTTITVKTGRLTVANARSPLKGPEIILVAKDALTVAPGARIVQTGSTQGSNVGDSATLRLGDAAVVGSGNGLLLRVSDVQVPVVRSGTTSLAAQGALANPPVLTIGAGAAISGSAVTLDSTYGTSLDPAARLSASDLVLSSGQISILLDNPGAVPATPGLILSGAALDSVFLSRSLSLLSYSSLDLYGTGRLDALGALKLDAGQIRGFNNAGGIVTFASGSLSLGNRAGAIPVAAPGALGGALVFDTGTLRLAAGAVRIDQFATTDLRTGGGMFAGENGSLDTQGALTITGPIISAARAVNYAITAAGALELASSIGAPAKAASSGLGATLSFTGTSLTANTSIALPSGSLTLRATTGDLEIGNLNATRLDVGGTSQSFNDLTRYTGGGQITIAAANGSVTLGADSVLDVAAEAGGGDAGSVSISAPNGTVILDGKLAGRGGVGGKDGSFALDVKSLPATTTIDTALNDASFDLARTFRVRSGDVSIDGLATAHTYRVSADQGSITVTASGNIDASGATGGTIDLAAFGDLTLLSGAQLSVAGDDFDAAGKGGSITLEAGAQHDGVVGLGAVDLQSGATLDLSVASVVGADAAETAAKTAAAAQLGRFTGKLHLRAPQNVAGNDLAVNAIGSTITGASGILVEGYRLFDLTNTSGAITNTGAINPLGGLLAAGTNVRGSINANGLAFLGAAGTTSANYTAMTTRLLGADPQGLASVFVLAPGAEVIHRTGDLTLGTSSSNQNSDWNLATFRYGAKSAAGTLTLRAAGNLTFFNALSDGFTVDLAQPAALQLYRAELSDSNPLLPTNTQSWSYRLSAGADLAAADFRAVVPLSTLGATSGSLQLGKTVNTSTGIPTASGGLGGAQTSAVLAAQNGRFQVIRTGSGDIEISTGRDVQLQNQLATIYTAGTRTPDPTLGGNFELPPSISLSSQGGLGSVQQDPTYAAQYSLAGGNVTIRAQQDIRHQTVAGGVVVADSQKQIPNNWLYRRGYVDATTGEFGGGLTGEIASTSWWVDFSNFFEGVGALGGGNVAMTAGRDISNVDAAAPTNGRVTFQTPTGGRLAADQTLVELGGGDVSIRTGRNLDAGIYYVERGRGTIAAGGSIVTNATRAVNPNNVMASIVSPQQWLPTTLFLGKGIWDVNAASDLLIGPTVNPFLLPTGTNNTYLRKSYFSTYAPTSELRITSLGGTVTIRENATPAGFVSTLPADESILQTWMFATHQQRTGSLAVTQPWLRLAESSVTPFSTVFTVRPGTLRVTSFSSDINVVGRLNLSPSPTGTIELAAPGAINALQPAGTVQFANSLVTTWTSSTINLSDASPAAIPGVNNPFALQNLRPDADANVSTPNNLLLALNSLFNESGSSTGLQAVIKTQQALHGTSLLHADDPDPIRIYASGGTISGLTLFSAKAARIVAGQDIADIAFYLQNNNATDLSVVSAGRDIIPYNASTQLRTAAQSTGNLLNANILPLAGDLQINGPGALEVLAGRNLDLGSGANNADGTGVGLTSIGNARNPNLPFAGADLIAAAGLDPAIGLGASSLDFDSLIKEVIAGADGERYLQELAETRLDLPKDLNRSTFEMLDPELRARLALEVFYLVLRDAGRDSSKPGGSYNAGFAAIDTLFGKLETSGDIVTRSRDIRTRSGGSISLLAPGGGLTLTKSVIGNPLAPPGVITEAGGNISIFTKDNVDIGIARIFTLRGGNQIIWSSDGNIAAGSSAKTVKSAPPTRVLIDPQTATVQTDLAGLATGGGIGVLATVAGVQPGDVDLIAPRGVVDAGDAGIRASGDLNIAAVQVLNADNIQAGGTTTGVPTAPVVAAPNLSGLAAASNSAGAADSAAAEAARPKRQAEPTPEPQSVITVDVVEVRMEDAAPASTGDDEEEKRRRRNVPTTDPPAGSPAAPVP